MKSLLVCIALPVAGASSLGHKLSGSAPSVELSLESSAHPLPELSSDLGELEATREGEESVSNACVWSTFSKLRFACMKDLMRQLQGIVQQTLVTVEKSIGSITADFVSAPH